MNRFWVYPVSVILASAGVWLFWPDGGEGDAPGASTAPAAGPSRAAHAGVRRRAPDVSRRALAAPAPAAEVSRARSKSRRVALARLERDWEALSGLDPAEMLAQQRELAARAVAELGAGPAMGRFMEFLKEKGAGDSLDWLATEGLVPAFSGPDAAGARAWLARLGDAKLAEKIGFQAGRGYGGADLDGFRDYL